MGNPQMCQISSQRGKLRSALQLQKRLVKKQAYERLKV